MPYASSSNRATVSRIICWNSPKKSPLGMVSSMSVSIYLLGPTAR